MTEGMIVGLWIRSQLSLIAGSGGAQDHIASSKPGTQSPSGWEHHSADQHSHSWEYTEALKGPVQSYLHLGVPVSWLVVPALGTHQRLEGLWYVPGGGSADHWTGTDKAESTDQPIAIPIPRNTPATCSI